MKRRNFLKNLALAPAGIPIGLGLYSPWSSTMAMDYQGKFFVFVQADGGWDPTSFCDPKSNTPGELIINNWAQSQDIQQVGNLSYAPFANNAAFFQKYYDRMLVINGVDAQTNSHSVGVVHNWSGRVSEGYPSMTALLAAANAPDQPMAYLNFGGFGFTANLVPSTRIDNPHQVISIAFPNQPSWDPNARFLPDTDFAALRQFQVDRANALMAESSLAPRALQNRAAFADANLASEALQPFAQAIPAEQDLPSLGVQNNNLAQQAVVAAIAFKTGAAVAADLFIGGFDTHQDHDTDHEPLLGDLTNGVDTLWTVAEEQGIADRLVVVIGSDFGRTNHYNATNGKDHWPIGSYIVMEKNVSWTNRMVGFTDELHNTYPVDPTTLVRDDANGTTIHPKHVHKALRSYFGLDASPLTSPYPFNNTENFAFFS